MKRQHYVIRKKINLFISSFQYKPTSNQFIFNQIKINKIIPSIESIKRNVSL